MYITGQNRLQTPPFLWKMQAFFLVDKPKSTCYNFHNSGKKPDSRAEARFFASIFD